MYQQQAHARSINAQIELPRVILKGLAYALFILLIVANGLNHSVSFDTRLITIAYFISGLALVRAFCEALDAHYDYHAGVFAIGLSVLSALA